MAAMSNQTKDEYAKQLVTKYFGLVCKIVRKHKVCEHDFDDMVQEGLLALLDADESYNEKMGVPFEAYISVCINRRVKRAVISSKSQKHRILDEHLPLEEQTVTSTSIKSPEQILVVKENIKDVNHNIRIMLSLLERKILYFYLEGFSYKYIAKRLGVSPKTVDNALRRVRKKLKNMHI